MAAQVTSKVRASNFGITEGSGTGNAKFVFTTFAAGAATTKVDCGGLKRVWGAVITYITAVASTDAPVSINNAAGNGSYSAAGFYPEITVDTDGTLTLTRPAGTTSDAAVMVMLIGQ